MLQFSFKEEFETILKKLKIKRRFLNNIEKQYHRNGDMGVVNAHLEQLNEEITFSEFINRAFAWNATTEGSAYWSYIYNQFRNININKLPRRNLQNAPNLVEEL